MPGRSADDHAAPSGAAHRAGRTIPRDSPVAKFVASFRDDSLLACCLAASAGRSAAHAAVAASVADHDGAAGGAAGRVAHLVHLAHGVGRVIDAAVLQTRPVRGARRRGLPRGLRLRRNAAACRGCVAGLAAHLVQPLGHLFGQPGQVVLRGDRVVSPGSALGIRLGEAGSCGACGPKPANSVNCVPERKRRLSQRKM